MDRHFQSSPLNSKQLLENSTALDELVIFRAVLSDLQKNPARLQALVVKAGIVNESGELTEAYRN